MLLGFFFGANFLNKLIGKWHGLVTYNEQPQIGISLYLFATSNSNSLQGWIWKNNVTQKNIDLIQYYLGIAYVKEEKNNLILSFFTKNESYSVNLQKDPTDCINQFVDKYDVFLCNNVLNIKFDQYTINLIKFSDVSNKEVTTQQIIIFASVGSILAFVLIFPRKKKQKKAD